MVRRQSVEFDFKGAPCTENPLTFGYANDEDNKVRAYAAKAAINLCKTCSFIDACLEAGLVKGENGELPAGVWGGKTRAQRYRLLSADKK